MALVTSQRQDSLAQLKVLTKLPRRWKVVAEGDEVPPIFFSAPLQSPPIQKFITTVHPTALQRWPMASLVIRFFSSLIPSNQRTITFASLL